MTNHSSQNQAKAQSTDWGKVRLYYLVCRSYKQTAEHFGINPETVKKRKQRGNWTSEGQDGGTKHVPPSPQDVPLSPREGTKHVPLSPQNVPSPLCDCLLPMLPNLASKDITFGLPWEQPVIGHGKLADKAVYRAYITNSNTRDCLFSGIREISKNQRIGAENKPAALLAVVVDYDKVMTDAERRKKTDKLRIKPNFISTSYSGGTHAVWLMEQPIPIMPGRDFSSALLKIIVRELRLANAYGVIDSRAFNNLSQYYHAGWDWQMIDSAPIPEQTTMLWLEEAMRKSNFNQTGVQIPLERVRAEMKKRGWDKRWEGEFDIGSRGVRFWDSLADCPTAAIVRENGMTCFTGAFPFRSWEDIFGHDFIADYKADTLGKALTECYFVNNSFYIRANYKCEDGTCVPGWQCLNRQNFEVFASEHYNVSSKAEIVGGESPLKQLMSKIISLNSLPAATPFIYRRETIVRIQGEPHLNTSFLRVHEPDLGKGHSWGDGFPWIAAFMERLFPDIIQRERFMAAWAYTYRNAYGGHPRSGHVLFVAGGVGSGKNFLSECLYGESLGGSADASGYILGQTRFNDHLMGIGVWTLNDTVAKGDAKERTMFAKALMKMAANQHHMCEGKFKKAAGIFWSGRIMVTLNTDPDSLQLLPDIEVSNRDKISLFKTSDEPMKDADGAARAKAEMGALCSFLLNWDITEHCEGDARWGVRNYLHPELLTEAANSGSTASFREILALFAKEMFDADMRLESLEGSATWFLQQMMLQGGIKDMLRGEVSARSIGKRMSALASAGEFPLEYDRKNTQRVWVIQRKAFMDYIEKGNTEGAVDDFFPF